MATIVKMPKWGLTMTQGTIVDWLVPEGTEVSEGDMLLTVETEKAVDDVGAPASGVLYKIVAPAGTEVEVSGPVAVIAAEGETLSDADIEALLKPAESTPVAAESSSSGTTGRSRERRSGKQDASGRISASPAAKKLAAELGVDLSSVDATGPNGRITSDDVQRAADEHVDPAPVERDVVLADGRSVHMLEAGPKSDHPLVFIHGLGGSLSSWQFTMGALDSDHRMTALDLPGHGHSSKTPPDSTDYSVAGLATDVSAILQASTRKPSVLIGHSMGGAVVMQVTRDHPELVAGLVLIDSACLGSYVCEELIDLMTGEPGTDTARSLLTLFFDDPKLVNDRGVEEMAGFQQMGGWEAQQALANSAFVNGKQRRDLQEQVPDIDIPVLLIWGERDRIFPMADAVSALMVFPDALLKIVTGVGHVPQVERPVEVAAAIDRFVRSLG